MNDWNPKRWIAGRLAWEAALDRIRPRTGEAVPDISTRRAKASPEAAPARRLRRPSSAA